MKFEETYLNDNILDALYDMHFDDMTPIQEQCIPEILDGYDVLGVAQTGTGKTAAYLLPILSELDDGDYPKDAINAVIMSPTRELAQQIDQAMQGFGYYLDDVSSVAVYGGNDGNRYDQELRSMRMGADVLIATPGRLLSHLRVGNLDLSRCSFFVLDEARELAVQLLNDPVEIQIAVSKPAEKIHQMAYVCYEPQKLKIIQDIFKKGDLQRVIIFSGKKERVKEVTRKLKSMHINCDQMHSDLSQAERDEAMYRFKAGQTDVLVATDIVARGIDIDDIRMVINYDVPSDTEDYVHRIGRTARADRDGEAITFISEDDIYRFQSIEHFLGKEVEKLPLPEGLGEAPAYTKREKKPNTRRNGRWHSKGSGKGKPYGKGKGKPKAKPKPQNNV